MSDTLDAILGFDDKPRAQPVNQPAAQAKPAGRDVLDDILGFAPQKAAKAELVDDPKRTLGFLDQAKGSFAVNDRQWLGHAAKTLYPDDPQAIRRFGKTPDGEYFHLGDDGKRYAVTPQSGMRRLANVGQGVGPAVPAVAGAVGGIAGLPFGGVGSIATAGGGAVAGEVARQTIGNAVLPAPEQIDAGQVVKEGVLSSASQGLGNAITKAAGRYAVPDIVHYDAAAANALAGRAENMGVRLTPAESTGLNSLVGEQKRLMAVPQSANTMGQFYTERNREVMDAWNRYLGSVATPRDASSLGRAAGEAAETMLGQAQRARTAAVDPFYDQAERQIGSVNPGAIVRFIDDALPTAKGSERKALEYARSQLRLTGEETVDMSFRGLDGAKKAIDTVLQNEDLAAKVGIDRTAHATLERIRSMLVDTIDNAPGARGIGGSPGPYAAGRATYGTMTESFVTPIEETLAPLLRISPTNSSINRAASALLDPAQRSPEVVGRARALIEPQYPQLWQQVKRQFLQEHAYAALQENAKGAVSNVGGNIAKRIGNDAIEANMRAAMRPEEFNRYLDIVNVFRATGRALDTNSDTAMKLASIERARDLAGGWVSRLVRNANPAELARNASAWLADKNYEKQAAAIAEIYARGDRTSINALRSLRQIKPSDERRYAIIGAVLTRAGVLGAEEALDLR